MAVSLEIPILYHNNDQHEINQHIYQRVITMAT